MSKQIQLIWDFRGTTAAQIAAHHAKHLNEYAKLNALNENQIGYNSISELHATATFVVDEKDLIATRDALKPHRAVLFEKD